MEHPKALIAGANGLIGKALALQASSDPRYSDVILAVRRAGSAPHGTGKEQIIDYENLSAFSVAGVRDVYCCLGTTIKKAGSEEAFERVDCTYVVDLARHCLSAGARHFIVVSAIGADAQSRIFYNRVKGSMEDQLRTMGFKQLTIVRPSMLGGNREEFRLGEKVASVLLKLTQWMFVGRLRRYRIVEDHDVASAMLAAAGEISTGVRIIESEDIPVLAAASTAN